MKRSLRLLVLSGALVLMAGPVFADGGSGSGSGPGGTNPPPAGGGSGTTPTTTAGTTTTSTGSATTVGTIEALLSLLGL